MPKLERIKTKYPGVYYVIGGMSTDPDKTERIYYIRYRREGKAIDEKAGRQSQGMTAAKANNKRAARIKGDEPTNKERREALAAARKGEAGKWTFSRLWEEYKRQKPDLKGLAVDESRYKNHIKPHFGGKTPSELVPLDVDRVRVRMLRKRKPQTVKLTLALLRRLANFGHKKGLCAGLSFTIEMPRVNNLKTEDLTPKQLKALFKAIEEEPHLQAGYMMRMALYTGMRRGEMFKLQWGDVDFKRGFISLKDPKGGEDQQIPMNTEARDLLESIEKTSSSTYVFPGRDGNQRTDIHHQVRRIKEKAGLPRDFRALHGLRHVYASMLASSGEVDLYVLQRLLTHKSPQMTQRYAHLRDEALKKAGDLAGQLIKKSVKKKKKGKKVVDINSRRK